MINYQHKKKLDLNPSQILVLGFALVILLGGILLSLPFTSRQGEGLAFLDALFTATSATCVTGLIVQDTATQFNFIGQLIILILIQVGGLGFMSMSMLIAIFLGQKIGLKSRILVQQAFNHLSLAGVVKLVRQVIVFTITIELIGAAILYLAALKYYDWPNALYFGFFHSISAFCNAGFDIVGGSRGFTPFRGDLIINMTISALIVLGGLGFIVLTEIMNYQRDRQFSLHSQMVLRVTGILIVIGMGLLLVLDFSNPATLAPMNWQDKLLASLFQSVTARTAGYNTIAIGSMTEASLFIMILLMFIGGSPGSTAGGIKTSTFGVMALAVRATIRGEDDIIFRKKRISAEVTRRAFAITAIALALVVMSTLILSVTEQGGSHGFLSILFEVVSAFATVGLTAGVTPDLTPIGKVIIIFLMFVGRLGPLTVAIALAQRRHRSTYRYAEERIMVG